MALVCGREADSVDRGFDVASSQEAEGVAGIDGQASVEGFGPFPLAGAVILDLQRSDGLTEEQSEGSEVGVAPGPETVGELLNLRGCELFVLHVSEMGFVVRVPAVRIDEEVRGELEGERDQVEKWV